MKNLYKLSIFTFLLFFSFSIYSQTGDILWEIWNSGIASLADLTTATNPNETQILTSIEGPINYADNYYSRMSGFLFPDETGDFTFYISSDDDSEFWLSTDSDPANAVLLCDNGYSPYLDWTRNASQMSSPIALETGKVYWFGVYHREGGGGDHCEVGWTKPSELPATINVIGSAYISQTSFSLIDISAPTITNDDLPKGINNQILYKIDFQVDQSKTTLDSLVLTTAGTYTATDITDFILWFNPVTSSLNGATPLDTIISASSGSMLQFDSLSQVINVETTGHFILTGNVSAGAINSNTINITSTDFSNINLLGINQITGTDPLAAGGVLTITDANESISDIIENVAFTYPQNIDYLQYLSDDITGTGEDIEIASFTLRDGGASGDADAVSTIIKELTIKIDSSHNVKKVAIYDGIVELDEVEADSIITFSGLTLEALQAGTKDFSIRISFKDIVIDNEQIGISIIDVVADGSGSLFADADAGGASTTLASLNDNKIIVTATDLVFTTQPSVNALINTPLVQQPIISAMDINYSLDLDFISDITLSSVAALGIDNITVTAVDGVANYILFKFLESGVSSISASGGSLNSLTNSNDVTIVSPLSSQSNGVTSGEVGQGTIGRRSLRIVVNALGANVSPMEFTRIDLSLPAGINPNNIAYARLNALDQYGNYWREYSLPIKPTGNILSYYGDTVVMNQSRNYYFEIVFDIDTNATIDNILDVQVDSCVVNGITHYPIIANDANTMTIKGGLTGTILIDNTLSGDIFGVSYQNFGNAIDDFNQYGVGSGGVTFTFKDDLTFDVQVGNDRFEVFQTGYPSRPVIFTRTNDGINQPILIAQEDRDYIIRSYRHYITFDGLVLGVLNPALTYNYGFDIRGEHNIIRNCEVDMQNCGGGGERSCIHVYSEGNRYDRFANYNLIENNVLKNQRSGIYLRRNNGAVIKGSTVRGNDISGFAAIGIHVRNCDSVVVANNHIHDGLITVNESYNYWFSGIYYTAIGDGYIYGNDIHNLVTTYNANGARVRGIFFREGQDTADIYVYNNMIYDLHADSSVNSDAVRAIDIDNEGNFHFYNNTFYLDYSTIVDGNGSIVIQDGGTSCELINNILANYTRVTGAGSSACIFDFNTSLITGNSDHNLYFSGTPDNYHLITRSGTIQDFATYQINVGPLEANSFTDSLVFVSPNDAHLPAEQDSIVIEQAAIPITVPVLIDVDIDGEKRNTIAPDLGADEGDFTGHDVNDAPFMDQIADPDSIFNDETPLYIIITGISDGDTAVLQNLTFTATSSDLGIISDPLITYVQGEDTAVLSYTHTGGYGLATVTIKIQDDGGTQYYGVDTSEIYTFDVTVRERKVNIVPALDAIADQNVPEDNGVTTISLTGITDGNGDSDAQIITMSASHNNPTLISGFTFNYSGGATATMDISTFSNANGSATITVYIADSVNDVYSYNHLNDSVKFTFTVDPVNDRPYMTLITFSSPLFDNGGPYVRGLSSIQDGDPELTQNITITATSNNTAILPDPVITYSGGATGTMTLNPIEGQSGNVIVTVSLQDDGGTANGGVDTRNMPIPITIELHQVNTAPSINAISDQSFNEDAGVQSINLTGISDGDGGTQTLNVTATTDNPSLFALFTTNYTSGSTGNITFRSATNEYGSANVTVKVADVVGAEFTNGSLADSVTFVLTINSSNDAPTLDFINDITVDTYTGPVTVNLTGIDDGEINENQTITIYAVSDKPSIVPDPTVNYTSGSTGTLSIDPVPTSKGTAQITVTVQDDGGVANGGVATFSRTFYFNNHIGQVSLNDNSNVINIYPVPTLNILNIDIPDVTINQLKVVDMSGKTIILKDVETGTNQYQLNVKNLPIGSYLLQLKSDNKEYKQVFIKE